MQPPLSPEALTATLAPAFSTKWPEPGKRWLPEAAATVGVYALVWNGHAYVGMTVSVNGFKGRWAKHHRSLFVLKRANSTTKAFRAFIKAQGLTASDFTLLALRSWPNPKDALTKDLTDEIALVEQEEYDRLEALGFTMLNNVRPRGTGYAKATRRKRRRRRPVRAKTA